MMGVITLITDFGDRDYYVALLKGHLLSVAPQHHIIDITHKVTPLDVMEGAFFVKSTYQRFPKATIHIIAVNTYYERTSRMVILKKNGYTFIAPNNGLLTLALRDLDESEVYEIADQDSLDLYDVIGQAMQGLAVGSPLRLLGHPVKTLERKLSLQPVVNGSQIRATIMYVDHFGNVIVNLSAETFHKIRGDRNFAIYYKSDEPIMKLSKKYNDVSIGDVCAFFNSIGYLEIAVCMGNAHQLLSLNKNETIHIDLF